MSTTVASIRDELGSLKEEWQKLDPTLRFLDLSSIALIVLFGIGYILVNILDIPMIVTNAAMLIFPLLLSGYIFVLRSKISNEEEDKKGAAREFLLLAGITLALIILTLVYSILLNDVLLN